MNNYNKLINNLETLGLIKTSQLLDKYIDSINDGSKTIIDALYELSEPSINKEQILNFKYLNFITKNENLIFIGSPGVGKTHLATSIGIEAAKARISTYFISCNDLVLQLKRAHLENRLEQRLKFFTKYKLLIIDEVGFLPLDLESSNLLFQLISRRYEKHSTIITTNKSLSKWGETFGDPVLANAILDRLLHHSFIINIVGRSYRTKDIIEDE